MDELKKEIDSRDANIRSEYNVARENCQLYFERMYKILEFTLGVMIAVIGIDVGVLGGSQATDSFGHIISLYVLPVCFYILGLLYVYNAYSLAIYGSEAQVLRRELYCKTFGTKKLDDTMREYIKTEPLYTKICYGACLLFYLSGPLISIIYGCKRILDGFQFDATGAVCECCAKVLLCVRNAAFPVFLWLAYLALMIILIVNISNIFKGRTKECQNLNVIEPEETVPNKNI